MTSGLTFVRASAGVRPLSDPCADFTGFPNAKMSPPATIPGWENARPEQGSHLHKNFLEKSRISNIPENARSKYGVAIYGFRIRKYAVSGNKLFEAQRRSTIRMSV